MSSIQEVAGELADIIANERLAVHPPELTEGNLRMTLRAASSEETFVIERGSDGLFLIGEPPTKGGHWTQVTGVPRRLVEPSKGCTEAIAWARRFKVRQAGSRSHEP
jgi:hypothetical protein